MLEPVEALYDARVKMELEVVEKHASHITTDQINL